MKSLYEGVTISVKSYDVTIWEKSCLCSNYNLDEVNWYEYLVDII